MQTRYLFLLRFILPLVDLLMLNAVYLISFKFESYLHSTGAFELQKHFLMICNLVWLVNSFVFGLYGENGANKTEKIYRATWKTFIGHFVLFTIYLFFSKAVEFPRSFIIIFYLVLLLALVFNRFFGTLFQYILIKRFKLTKKVAIMGNNYTAARLKKYIKLQRNIDFYGFIGTHDGKFSNDDGELHDDTIQQISEAVKAGVKDLYVCIPPEKMEDMKSLIYEADKRLLRLKFIPDIFAAVAASYTMSYMAGEFPVITIRNEPLELMSNRFKKRAFDITFSILVVIFLLSWLYPIIAILIKLESSGPVLFKQQRSGRNDIPFWCYKFRSMRNNTTHSTQATKHDMRITKIGRILRKTSLDELPQFLNVIQGKMSVVGPRPHMLKHTDEYRSIIDKFMVRHFCKPGITGFAQVNGFRGETKVTKDMENRVENDIYYVENWTLMWDVKIIFLTIINVIRGEDNAF